MANMFLIQGVGFIAAIFSISVFQFNKRKQMQGLNVIASLLWSTHFLLLGAPTGVLMNLINAVRYYVFRKNKPSKRTIWILYIFLVLACVGTAVTWQGWLSLLALAGTILSTIAYWPSKPKTIRRLALTVPPFWFSYNAITGSIAGMFVEAFLFISNLIGQYRFDISRHRKSPTLNKRSPRRKRAILGT